MLLVTFMLVACAVMLRPGVNSITLQATDALGHMSSVGLTVSRIGVPSALRLVASYCELLTRRHVGQLGQEGQEFVTYALEGTQRSFWAIPMTGDRNELAMREELYGLDVAEADGTLAAVGSTWSPENDGMAASGSRADKG